MKLIVLMLLLAGCGPDEATQIDTGTEPVTVEHPGCERSDAGTYFCIRGPSSLLDAGTP